MFNEYDDFPIVKGVILARKPIGENNLWTTLFLEDAGIMSFASKNFMGDSEPFVWGEFFLQRKQRGKSFFIFDADIKDCMLKIRRGLEPIKTAFNFSILLMKYLLPGHPDDELLTNLYWNMKLLTVPYVPPSAANWRFLWKWLQEWGLAPELIPFHTAKGFNNDEIILLSQLSMLTAKDTAKLFSKPLSPNIRENIFRVASKLAVNFLDEK